MVSQLEDEIRAGDLLLAAHADRVREWRETIDAWADYPDHLSPNVATIGPDGSDLQMLTDYTGGEVGAFAGSYSPDGRWIVFRVEDLSDGSFRLFKMRPDGSDRTLIARLPFAPRGNDWGSRPD